MLLRLFSFLFCLSIFLQPQTIKEIRFESNKIFSSRQLQQFGGVFPPFRFSENMLDSIKNNIEMSLRDAGYFHSSIKQERIAIDTANSILEISIAEGEPTFINEIHIQIADSNFALKKMIDDQITFLQKSIYNSAELEKTFSEILRALDNSGFPFARIEIESLIFSEINNENIVDISARLLTFEKLIVDKIVIKGNDKTEDYVILRELPVAAGDIYSNEAIKKIPAKLNRLRFFEPVAEPNILVDSKRSGILEIVVKEKSTSNFDGVIGYIPPAKNETGGYLTGLVNINLRNIFGTGRAALIKWQRIDRASQELELKYLEPWFLSFPFDIAAGMIQRKQDSSFIKNVFDGAADYRASDEITFGFNIAYEKIVPIERAVPIFTVYNSSALTSGLQFKYDSRDDPVVPISGFYLYNSYAVRKKSINGPAEYFTSSLQREVTFQKINFEAAYFHKLFSTQVIAFSIDAKLLAGSFFELSDLFFLGGTNSLRGYRENQFQGSSIAWSNFEYRFLLSQRSFAFLFFDDGYFYRPEDAGRNILRSEGFKYSFGAGLTFETGIGLMNVSYALGEGDSFADGKIHFGIVNEF